MANTSQLALATLCLTFTGPAIAWADPSHEAEDAVHDRWVEDPYQSHDTTGAEVRLGSLVGILAIDGKDYTALGGSVAAGHRWGPLAIDAEYGYFSITERGPSDLRYGATDQIGVNVRLEVLRFDSTVVGPNSLAAIYLEGGAGRQFRRPDTLDPQLGAKPMPGGAANQVSAGFGFLLDHRLEQPLGFPNRVGWQLGWRIVGTPRPEPDQIVTCRGGDCTAAKMAPASMMQFGTEDTSLVVTSSLAFTW